MAAWLAAAALLGTSARTALLTGAVTAMSAGGAALASRRRVACGSVAAAALLCAAAAAFSVGLRLTAVARGPLPSLAAEHATATVGMVVRGTPRLGAPHVRRSALHRSVVVHGRAAAVVDDGRKIRVSSPIVVIASGGAWVSLTPSQRIRVRGRLIPPDPDELLSAVLLARGPPTIIGGPSWPQSAAEQVRDGLRTALQGLPQEQRGLVLGLVLGDTSTMPPRLTEDFRTTGLAHLLAVSGANVAIILGALLAAARIVGLGIRVGAAVGGVGILAYALLAGPEPSVLRATVMGLVTVAAIATGRARSGPSALGVAVLALVLFDPGLARSYGFALSVLATGGLILLAPAMSAAMSRRVPRPVAEALAVTVAAQLACLPVLVTLSGRISLTAVPCNLLAAPAVPPATVLGLLAAVIAMLAPLAGSLVAAVAGACAGWIVHVARAGADLPYAAVHWPSSLTGALVIAALCAVLVVALRYRALRRYAVVAVAGVLLAVVFVKVLGSTGVGVSWPPRGWRLVACDVGQGDALVLAVGRGTAVVVDAGPDPRLIDRCLDDLGIDRVPLLVLSHLHADHVEGLPGVLDGRTVGTAVTGPLAEPPEGAARVVRWLREAHVPLRHVTYGAGWRVGALRLSVLGPRDRPEDGDEEAINAASLVVRASWPRLTALLTGDIGAGAQRSLLEGGADVGSMVLKVPHHGSADQDADFIEAVGAGIGLISVGADNDYGHPAAHTLRLLHRVGTRTFRTDREGDLAVMITDHGVAVAARAGDVESARAVTRDNQRPVAPASDHRFLAWSARSGMLVP
ncbi:MAG: ComEC/Rec2 family competence protein [Streptosporangiaceae bacterium]